MFARDMNIVSLQKRDHARLDALLHLYELGSTTQKSRAYSEILTLVTTHAFAEEIVLFPTARRALGHGEGQRLTADIEAKHQRINGLMAAMDAHLPGDPMFEAFAAELFPLLRADVRQEEDELLTGLSEVLDRQRLHAIGATWQAAKRIAPNRAHPGISRRPPGNLLAGIPLAVTDRVRRLVENLRH